MIHTPELPLYIDSSMLSTYRACKRKFLWSSLLALYPTGRSVHLIAGAAFAAGMEAARRLAFTSNSDSSHQALLEAALPAFLREWGDFDAPEGSAKTLVNTFSALSEYLELHHPLRDIIQPHTREDGSPAVEFTFAIPLVDPMFPRHPSGEPFVFVGRFDMLGYYGSERLPVIVDEKTTSSIGFAWENQWSLRGQFLGYIWALQQLGFSIQNVAVRGIAIQKTQFKFATALPTFGHHMVARWEGQLINDLIDITETYKQWIPRVTEEKLVEGYWDMNLADACTSYGGCAFTTLCSAKRAQPFFTNYIKHRWDPLARNPVIEVGSTQGNGDAKCSSCQPAAVQPPLSQSVSSLLSPPPDRPRPIESGTQDPRS
jgi:hypothetical protein